MSVSRLDDPEHAAHAWGRFRDIMAWMVLAAALATVIGILVIHWQVGTLPWFIVLATALGVFFTVAVAAALMGLVFLSAGTGHDESIEDPTADKQ